MHKVSVKAIAALLSVIIILTSCPSIIAFAADKADGKTDGTFVCDWFNESITYPFTYSDNYLSGSSYDYNHELATFALCVSMASFASFDKMNPDEHVKDLFTQCGYNTASYGYDTEGYDTVGLEIGRKDVNISGSDYTVLILTVRSGNYGLEWGGNLRIGTGVNHEGFDLAKKLVYQYLNDYLSKNEINNEVKLLISGYSRGASITDLVAAGLDDSSYKDSLVGVNDNIAEKKIEKDNVYAYTFEAPQCTKSENASDKVYGNIFNVLNPSDYVTKFVMDDWGFTHYGVELNLPSAENCNNYSDYYKKVCREFDTMMAPTGKQSGDYFYNRDDSKSADATLDFIFEGFAKKVFISQEYYAENYQEGIVFIAGQYLGRKLGQKDIAKTLGVSLVAAAVSIIPSNLEKIKSDGYRTYLAKRIAQSDAGASLTDQQISSLLDVLMSLLDFLSDNTNNVYALMTQLKTMLYIHQPYIELSWMRVLSADDIKLINDNKNTNLTINYTTLDLKHNTNGRLEAKYDSSEGYIKWTSDDSGIASVDSSGNVKAGARGTTTVTATLYDKNDEPIAKSYATVNVHMNIVQVIVNSVKDLVGQK
jgi:hypothetical protein